MYALAANCPNLQSITVGGYNEHVTDGGMTVLFEACKQLHYVRLSSKLLKVTDTSGATLASSCPSLTHVKLTKAMTDSTLLRLSLSCKLLQEVDMHR
jgi:23S rRNA G2069 N7-methylase RlmK/C1962 C5-methylase RlmI